jgi:hypothetical protein
MTHKARLFITLTVLSGACLIGYCLSAERSASLSTGYLLCILLTVLASMLKVRMPGITGTISVNFVFILFAVAVFTFEETVLLAAAGGLVQCLWRAKRQPKVIQVCFNVATLAISGGATYRVSHLFVGTNESYLMALLSIAGACYFTADTLLVSGVLSLIEQKPLLAIWRQCYFWSFPYYMVGGLITALVVSTYRVLGWQMSLLTLPVLYLVFVFYRMCVERIMKTSTGTVP